MLVVDEYLAVRIVAGDWPDGLPHDAPIALPAYRHYRLLQRVHRPGDGQLSTLLRRINSAALRSPHPGLVHILDPRPIIDLAAEIGATYRAGGLLIGETLAAGLTNGRQLWFGEERNVGHRLAEIAAALSVAVHVVGR